MVNVKGAEPFFGPPKAATSVRMIPLPAVVVDALETHRLSHPGDSLVFTNIGGGALRRSAFWTELRRATRAAGLPHLRFHELQYYYASLLIRHGESVRTVQATLGHAGAAETLDTYSHPWPDSDQRTEDAVDGVLRNLADYLRTGNDPQRNNRRSEP